jgi:hypothetical protein
MFPGINKKEQDRVRARFSMDVTKRCSAEIKQAHKQFAGHMTKIIRKLSSNINGYTPLICVSPRYLDEALFLEEGTLPSIQLSFLLSIPMNVFCTAIHI